MTSRFDERWSRSGEPVLTRHFSPTGAFAVTYSDASLAAPKVIAGPLVTREKSSRRNDDPMGGWRIVTTRTVRFAKAGNPTPRLDGTISIEGVAYAIENETEIENQRYECELIRVEAGEITRDNYRR